MSTYHDHLFIKTPKQIYSREIIKQLNYLWQDSSTYQTQLGGSGNKSKDLKSVQVPTGIFHGKKDLF